MENTKELADARSQELENRVSKIEALIKRKADAYRKRKADYEAKIANWNHPLDSPVEPELEDWEL